MFLSYNIITFYFKFSNHYKKNYYAYSNFHGKKKFVDFNFVNFINLFYMIFSAIHIYILFFENSFNLSKAKISEI